MLIDISNPLMNALAAIFRRPIVAPTPAAQLAKIGHEQRRAKYRATARAVCVAMGRPIPTALKD